MPFNGFGKVFYLFIWTLCGSSYCNNALYFISTFVSKRKSMYL